MCSSDLFPSHDRWFETDAPYLTPTPHRGKRNEPAYTNLVVIKASEILGVDTRELLNAADENTKRLFGI